VDTINFWQHKHSFIHCTCSYGLAPFLEAELAALGYPAAAKVKHGATIRGGMREALRCVLHLRTAHRVLFSLQSFDCSSADQLYAESVKLPWETIIDEKSYISVTSTVHTPSITDSRFVNLKCKDAIVDRIMQRRGRRPDSGPECSGAVIHVHWSGTRCLLYADLAGETLSRRGYRALRGTAPLQETLAAGLVMATGWQGQAPFVNPMCGAGTIAIEAALIGSNHAPGLLRNEYGFRHFLGIDAALWDTECQEARKNIRKLPDGLIIATDNNQRVIEKASINARNAGVASCINFSVCDFGDTPVPENRNGFVLFNPAYGIRLGDADLKGTYAGIGKFLKRKCQGYKGYVLTGNTALVAAIGLKSSRKMPFDNGSIPCTLYEYELYRGRRDD
jgi:putative N6-adenine-specific DNA methylase